jgi:GT2 family glycosyltransferase
VAEAEGFSVLIPTFNRPDQLRRAVRAVLDQDGVPPFRVILANDGTVPVPDDLRSEPQVTIVDGPFGGPAAARNAAIARADGEVVIFTDDDTIPRPGWLRAALDRFQMDGATVGVVGRVECPAFDPLSEYSVSASDVGDFLTCNVAYRRTVLEMLGGFDERFFPGNEDRDLGYRVSQIGSVVYEPTMVVDHPVRRQTVRDIARRGRSVPSDWRLLQKHPDLNISRWPLRWAPVMHAARHWQRLASHEVAQRSWGRVLRVFLLGAAEITVALWVSVTRSPSRSGAVEWRPSDVGRAPDERVG